MLQFRNQDNLFLNSMRPYSDSSHILFTTTLIAGMPRASPRLSRRSPGAILGLPRGYPVALPAAPGMSRGCPGDVPGVSRD
ncbi:hypothetical protein L484_019759 [Morus notabilis]|uniref:Uncharacterized protein n=1 Tax=Morus notabilis TaxID=981085 RepID=W9QRV9_9ROSA|nr:hypothetical protein L484_019759 [Morus notabilis]